MLLTFIPDSRLNKTYKSFIALITMFMLITPFANAKNIDISASATSFSSAISEEELMCNDTSLVLSCAEDLLNKSLDDAIKGAGINASCKSNIKEQNGEAYISKINIYGELSEDEEIKVVSIINGITGGVEIEFIG